MEVFSATAMAVNASGAPAEATMPVARDQAAAHDQEASNLHVGDLRARVEARRPHRGATEEAITDAVLGVAHHSQLDAPHAVDDGQGGVVPGGGSTPPTPRAPP